jgi:hypothetical protein
MRKLLLISFVLLSTGCSGGLRSNARLWPGQENSSTIGTDFKATIPGRMVPPSYPGVDLVRRSTSLDQSTRQAAHSND